MNTWDAVVAVMAPLGCHEQRSRWGDKPALVLNGREIAHSESPGSLDVRITAAGWRGIRADWSDDPRVTAVPGRRDWIELTPATPADVADLTALLHATVEANR